jgi:hypothetical protein
MQTEPAIITYVYAETFEKSLKIIRSTLQEVQLCISWEYDISTKIKQKLGVGLAPCTILYVDCPFLLLEALAFDGRTAAIFPFHVLVSEDMAARLRFNCLAPHISITVKSLRVSKVPFASCIV